MKIRTILQGVCVFCACLPLWLRAQPNPAIEQYERTQRQMQLPKPRTLNLSTNKEAPELYPGENADVGPQRILRLTPRKTHFEVVADSQFLYTDNAYLSDNSKIDTTLFVNTIQAAFAPEPAKVGRGQFAPTLGYRSQWFNYDLAGGDEALPHLDFTAQTAFLNGRYQLGEWQFFGGFDFTRLLDQSRYEEVYREYTPAIGLQRFITINDKLMIVVGGQFSYHFTDMQTNSGVGPDVNNRYELGANISLNYEIIPRLILQPFYRFQYSEYRGFTDTETTPAAPRYDYVHTAGASVAYYFNRNVAVRLFASYECKDSSYSTGTYDYHKFDAGGGLTLDFRF